MKADIVMNNFYKILSRKKNKVVVELPAHYMTILDMYKDDEYIIPRNKEKERLDDETTWKIETKEDIKCFLDNL